MIGRTCRIWLLLTGILAAASPSTADVSTDWNEHALAIVVSISPREMAMMDLAMFQCVNAIDPRYEFYRFRVDAATTTSKEAAAAVAAASILLRLYGGESA